MDKLANSFITAVRNVCQFLTTNQIDYMLVGGLAVGLWSKPRATVDIDLMVAVTDKEIQSLIDMLRKDDRFSFVHNQPMTFANFVLLRSFVRCDSDRIMVDFVLADDHYKQLALSRRIKIKIDDLEVFVITPEDLIILKLLSKREQDNLDTKAIVEAQKEALDTQYLKEWIEKLGIRNLKCPSIYSPIFLFS